MLCVRGTCTTQNVSHSGCSWANGFLLAISMCPSFIESIVSYPHLFPWHYMCFTHFYHLVMNFHMLWQLQTLTLDHVFMRPALFKVIVMVMWHVYSVLLWLSDDANDLLLPITKWNPWSDDAVSCETLFFEIPLYSNRIMNFELLIQSFFWQAAASKIW